MQKGPDLTDMPTIIRHYLYIENPSLSDDGQFPIFFAQISDNSAKIDKKALQTTGYPEK